MASRFNLLDYNYAHRGLWDLHTSPENSLEAILAAGRVGLGCEIDVRPASCGTPVVFHDPLLDRMTGETGFVCRRSAEEISRIRLNGGGTLPTLEEVLERWTFDSPLLIELKIDGLTDAEQFTASVSDLVSRSGARTAMMSFSRQAVAAMPADVMKGVLLLPSRMAQDMTLQGLVRTSVALQPDFIAAHLSDAREVAVTAGVYDLPVAIWTVDSPNAAATLSGLRVAQIFEGFDPAFARRAS